MIIYSNRSTILTKIKQISHSIKSTLSTNNNKSLLGEMSNSNCIFCNIISGNAPADILHEDEELIVFRDIKPAAKFHYLAVPKKHIPNVNHLVSSEDGNLLLKLIVSGKNVLSDNGGDVNDVRLGFHRPPFNSIGHLHLHIISPASSLSFISHYIFKPDTLWFQTERTTLEKLGKL